MTASSAALQDRLGTGLPSVRTDPEALVAAVAVCGFATSRAGRRSPSRPNATWLEHSIKAFDWLMPVEIRVFELDDIDKARAWMAATDDDAGN